MEVEFVVCEYSESSRRYAVLADDGVTGILYLHASSDDAAKTGAVEATCFAYNRVDPIDTKDVQSYRPNPPPIAKPYASKDAVCQMTESHKWHLTFSLDGSAVLLIKDGKPWAMVSLDTPHGFSKAIEAQGPWGSPWSVEAYMATDWSVQTKS